MTENVLSRQYSHAQVHTHTYMQIRTQTQECADHHFTHFVQ